MVMRVWLRISILQVRDMETIGDAVLDSAKRYVVGIEANRRLTLDDLECVNICVIQLGR